MGIFNKGENRMTYPQKQRDKYLDDMAQDLFREIMLSMVVPPWIYNHMPREDGVNEIKHFLNDKEKEIKTYYDRSKFND